MQKIEYVTPSIEVIEIEVCGMIAASPSPSLFEEIDHLKDLD